MGSNEGNGSIWLAVIMLLVSLHVIVIFSYTTLKEPLIERKKNNGMSTDLFCCDELNFWYILFFFREVIFTANHAYLP